MQRARRRSTSFSQEVREAVNFYLELSPGAKEELVGLAAAANQATDRMLRDLDKTIAALRRVTRRAGKKR